MNNKTREKIFLTGCLLGILISLLSLPDKLGNAFHALPFHLQPNVVTEVLNIVVLLFFFFSVRAYSLELNNEDAIIDLAKKLDIEDRGKVMSNNERVNKVVEQFCAAIWWFIGTLIVFYSVNFIKDVFPEAYAKWNGGYPWMDFLEINMNLLSGAFIYLSYIILYKRTVDQLNQSSNYKKGTIIFVFFFVVFYGGLLSALPEMQAKISSAFRLISGIFNGFSMVLLFGRVNAIEFNFKDPEFYPNKWSQKVYKTGVTVILPLYVLAQPLYNEFAIPQFIINTDVLKSVVFLVCFIGKGFFLLFVGKAIDNRWLHVYLHLTLANRKKPQAIVDAIKNNIDSGAPGTSVLSVSKEKMSGIYDYICQQRGAKDAHGGICLITAQSNAQQLIECKLEGKRKWSKYGNGRKVQHTTPFSWVTEWGMIFSDGRYSYEYHINLDSGLLFGRSHGTVVFSEDRTEILELHGEWTQQCGNKIVFGEERFVKKGAGVNSEC